MAVGQTLKTNLWAAIIDQNGIPQSPRWNGDVNAFPGFVITDTAKGGADFSGAQIPYPSPPPPGLLQPPRTPLYLTVTGSNCIIKVNTGQEPFRIENGGFGIGVPDGYFPGWPDQAGFPAQLDPATASGSVGLPLITPYVVDFTGDGVIQIGWPHGIGNYYFEYTLVGTDVFTAFQGAGVGRAGAQFPYVSTYLFSASDSNGGAGTNGEFVNANGAQVGNDIKSGGGVGLFTTVGVAVSIFPPPAVFVPVDFHPIALKCTPCDGITLQLAQRKASANFG